MNKLKTLSFFLCLIYSCLQASAAGIQSSEGVVDGIKYRFYYHVFGMGETPNSAMVIALGGDGYSGDVIIPEKVGEYPVKRIDKDAFIGCTGLTSVYLPATIGLQGDYIPSQEDILFSGCVNLGAIVVETGNPVFDSRENCNCLIKTADNKIVSGCKNSIIPNSVTQIGEHAFDGCVGLKNINFPDNVWIVGKYAFQDCNGLTSINTNNVREFGLGAFNNCAKLTRIEVGNPAIYGNSFSNLQNLEVFVLNSDYGYIYGQGDVFYNTPIENAKLYVPTKSREGYKSHEPWKNFKEVLPINGIYILYYIVDGKEFKTYEIKEGTDITPEAAPENNGREFSGWTGLPEKMPSDDVKVTGRFKYNVKYMVDGTEYKTVGVFYGDAITPEENPVKKGYTFSGWSEIPETMPEEDIVVTGTFDSTEMIKNKVRYKVTDNEKNYCKVIGNDNASGVIKIDSVEIDECYYQPTEVADKAFYGCKDITKLEIPATVATIGERAFANIDKLTDVTCWAGEVPTIDRTAFENSYIEDYVTLHVPYGALEKYKTVAPWKNFKEIMAIDGTQKTYTITYIVDGEVYKTVEVKEGEAITPEADPTREGYTFSGWSEIPDNMPSNDLTITGAFKVNTYKLIYLVDGEEYKSYDIDYGTEITPEGNPTKEGYIFSGWDEIPQTMPAKDVTINGTFTKGAYTITYVVDGVTYKTVGYNFEDKITPEAAPEKEGYTFSGWSEIPETMPAHDVTVNGTFTINKYNLIYKVDGEVYKTYEIKEGETITPEAEPIKEGYTFSGWSDIPAVMPSEDLTITGTFTINKYKLTYIVDEKEYKVFEVEYNATITPVPAPEKEGYTFSGWSEIPEKMPAKDVTVAGAFTINKYKLLYMVDDTVYDESEVEYGAAITPLEAPAKEGYTFSGWSEIPETMPAKDVTVTGTFTINKYKLTYMVDGEVYKTYDVEYGATVTPEAEPTKEGYTFSGWSTIPNTMPANDVTVTGSFTKGAYKLIYKIDGEVYKTYTYDFGAEITPEPAPEKEGYSFLGWSDIPEIMPANDVEVTGSFTVNKYNLIYKVDGDVYKEYEMEYGAEITPEEEPTKEGWEFSGWSWIPKKMPAEDVVIMGTFKQLDYAVDGGTFTIDDGEATLKGGGEAKGALVINNNVTINGKVYVVVNIGNGAFKGNKDITSVELPDGIKNIGAGAFDGCSSLLKVLLGKGVKKIGSKAFGNIWKAAAMTRAAGDGFRVECNAESVPEIETDAFEGTDIDKATLVVKDELVNSYKAAEVWKNFGNIIGQTETTSVDGVFVDNPSAVIYSIDGKRLDKVQKGMNVIWTEKGVKKVVVR